jgi:hypothetical protein
MKTLARISLIATLACVSWLAMSCDKQDGSTDQTEATTGDDESTESGNLSCRDQALAVVERLQKYDPLRPEHEVGFELPEADGKTPPFGTLFQVSRDYIEVDGKRFVVPEDADLDASGGFPRPLISDVRGELGARISMQQRQMEALGEESKPRMLLAVHPDISASAVEGLVSNLGDSYQLYVLAHKADAEEPPERTKVEWLEPKLSALEAEDDAKQAVAMVKKLEKRIMGSCDSQLLRTEIGRRIGVSRLTRQVMLSAKPLPDKIAECGCDNVDLEAFQATMEWALMPQHPPLVALENSFERVFSDGDATWSEVVAGHRK